MLDAVILAVKKEVLFADQFGDAVGAAGLGLVRLVGRKIVLLAIDRPARGGEDDPFHSGFGAGLEDIEKAEHIVAGVIDGILDGAAHIHLRGMMIDDLDLVAFENIDELRVLDIHLVKDRFGVEVLPPARAQVIHHNDLVAGGDIGIGDLRGDKTGAAGDEDFHAALLKIGLHVSKKRERLRKIDL